MVDGKPLPVYGRPLYINRRGVHRAGMPAFPNIDDRDAWPIASLLESKKGDSGEKMNGYLGTRRSIL
jgi:mono/diheme cytochrome c family protein